MKEFLIFSIKYSTDAGSSNQDVIIRDRATFDTLRRLSLKEQGQNPDFQILRFEVGSPQLSSALDLIKKRTGRRPRNSRLESHEPTLTSSIFRCDLEREYGPLDITNSELLRLRMSSTSFYEMGDSASAHHPDAMVVRGNSKLKNCKWHFGCISWCEGLVCSDEFRKRLEKDMPRGLLFKPVLVDPPERSHYRTLWQISSNVILPPLQLSLTSKDGKPFSGPLTNSMSCQGCLIQEGNVSKHHHYVFDKKAISELQPFDISITRERFGMWDNSAYRSIIVSQHWRELFQQMDVPGTEYLPVVLNEENVRTGQPIALDVPSYAKE